MTMDLDREVSLTRDLPEYGLRTGDIATLIDFVPHPNNGEEGCVLEIFNAIETLRSDGILAVHTLAKVS